MQQMPRASRRAWGCGFEPRLELVQIRPWRHQGDANEYTACPGYTTSLPEVHEIARARMHAKNNMFSAFVRGEPSELLLRGIEVLEAADCDATAYRPPEAAR